MTGRGIVGAEVVTAPTEALTSPRGRRASPSGCLRACVRWRASPTTTAGAGRRDGAARLPPTSTRTAGGSPDENPVRFLGDLWPSTQLRRGERPAIRERVAGARRARSTPIWRGRRRPRPGIDGPVAFLCAEFGVHASLPVYSGGLGVLAGDILKEASDRGSAAGRRRPLLPARLLPPAARPARAAAGVLDPARPEEPADGARDRRATAGRCELSVHVFGREIALPGLARGRRQRAAAPARRRAARERPGRSRWTTARLYEGNRAHPARAVRRCSASAASRVLAGARDRAGRPAPERRPSRARGARARRAGGRGGRVARGCARGRCASASSSRRTRRCRPGTRPTAPTSCSRPSTSWPARLGHLAGRVPRPVPLPSGRRGESPGHVAARDAHSSRTRNGVSRLHGEVARAMWQPMFPGTRRTTSRSTTSRTARTCRRSSSIRCSRCCSTATSARTGWREPADPAAWEPVREIPNAELWARARRGAQAARRRGRGEGRPGPAAARRADRLRAARGARLLDAGHAHARLRAPARDATSALNLLISRPASARSASSRGRRRVQLLLAGKAHPLDEDGKGVLAARCSTCKVSDRGRRRASSFLEDYDLVARAPARQRAATSGSTCRGGRWRRAARAG